MLRGAFWAAAGAALVLSGTSVAGPIGSLTATLSNTHAGARPVVLTLALRTELQCGRLVGGALMVRLLAQERVPARVAAKAVLVGGKPAGAVAVAGHTLTVSIPRPPVVMCDVIGPGTVKLVLTRAANLGNPKAAGSYPLVVTRGADQFKTTFKISRAG